MKKNNKSFFANKKGGFLLISAISLLSIAVMSVLIISGISKHNRKNNSVEQTNANIKSNFLKSDSTALINSVFVNILPDGNKTSTIYIGGSNLKATNGKISSLVSSTDNGKNWVNEEYFAAPTTTPIFIPVVNKIMTDFYTDGTGTSDSIVVTGQYLPSVPVDANGKSQSAGQIAFEQVYYAKKSTNINEQTNPQWADISLMDGKSGLDSKNSTIIQYQQRLMGCSTVKTSITIDGADTEQNHIYFIFNDENISVNNPSDIPSLLQPAIPLPKFYYCDLYINEKSSTEFEPVATFKRYDQVKNSGLTNFLNPGSIYGILDPTKDHPLVLLTRSIFIADDTTFVFKSGIKTSGGRNENKCIIVENQYFESPTGATKKVTYNNPYVIEYNISSNTPLTLNLSSKYKGYFDNFIVKTIAINPMILTDDDNHDNRLLIFGGQKDNKSYMVSPIQTTSSQFPLIAPGFPDTAIKNTADGSYINQIISFPKVENSAVTGITLIPLAIFGHNMNSSNPGIALPDPIYAPTANTQDFTNQGMLLANISINTNSNTTSVVYSQYINFKSTADMNVIQTSDSYSNLNTPSLYETNYAFIVTPNFSSVSEASGFTYLQITKSSTGNNFNFKPAEPRTIPIIPLEPNGEKSKKWETHILLPIVIVVILIAIFSIMVILFMKKGMSFTSLNKGDSKNRISDNSKKKRQISKRKVEKTIWGRAKATRNKPTKKRINKKRK